MCLIPITSALTSVATPPCGRMRQTDPTQVAISVVTVEEQLRGWLAVIRRATTPQARAVAYERLRMTVEYCASITVLDYTVAIDARVADLRRQGLRIGTQDLRIAATVLAHGATLVTRNETDFRQVSGLQCIDWSRPASAE